MLQAVALVATLQFVRVDDTQELSDDRTLYPAAQVVQTFEEEQLEQLATVQLVVVLARHEYVTVVVPVEAVYENPVLQAEQT